MATISANYSTTVPATRPSSTLKVESLQKNQKTAQKIGSILDLDQLIDEIVNRSRVHLLLYTFICMTKARGEMVIGGVHGLFRAQQGFPAEDRKDYLCRLHGTNALPQMCARDEYYVACGESTRSKAILFTSASAPVGVFTASHPDLGRFSAPSAQTSSSAVRSRGRRNIQSRRFQSERAEREAMSLEAQEARAHPASTSAKSSLTPGLLPFPVSIPPARRRDWYDFIPFPVDVGPWFSRCFRQGMAAALPHVATRGILRSLAEACCLPEVSTTQWPVVEDFPAGRFVTLSRCT